MHRRQFIGLVGGSTAAVLAGCVGDSETGGDAAILDETLTLTTTTSTYDTGLLGEVNGAFTDRFGAEVDAVAQGTGAALETARRGDSDVVMVHARGLEDEFMREGYGVNRRDLMFNDFVVVGPDDDPAGIDGMNEVTDAFAAIADAEAIFVSRGDNSGTHNKELNIWEAAGIEPSGEWYREAGSGMGEVLNQADLEEGAHTLADRGTFISQRSELESLAIRVQGPIEGGPELLANPYGVIAVNPAVHDNVNYDLAMAYIGFITSRDGQELIREYTVEGEQLFFPEAVAEIPNFQQYVPEDWKPET
ncbi:molybdenum transporter [Halobacteriales archaeon QH_2_65_14]|nr:MAG: molybdenum transporter [Halobacteriales archaeon QH_2_65_14]